MSIKRPRLDDLQNNTVMRSARRDWLAGLGTGLGAIACGAILGRDSLGQGQEPASSHRGLHHATSIHGITSRSLRDSMEPRLTPSLANRPLLELPESTPRAFGHFDSMVSRGYGCRIYSLSYRAASTRWPSSIP